MAVDGLINRALAVAFAGVAMTMTLGQSMAEEALAPDSPALHGPIGLLLAQAAAPAPAAPAAPAAVAGNATAGAAVFLLQCRVCHTSAKDGPDRFGPNLFGIVGKQAASDAKFAYSDAFKKAATWKWDPSLIGGWISNPAALIPGNAMAAFPGVADKDRDNVIAFLASLK